MGAGEKIAGAGATGRAGRHLVELLAARGHDIVAMGLVPGQDAVLAGPTFEEWLVAER